MKASALLLFIFSCFSGVVFSTSLNGFVIFGDSLSDTGNLYEFMQRRLPASPPYFDGRFTNGPVWIEWLSKMIFQDNAGEHLENYAFGGAGILEDENDIEDEGPLFTLQHEVDSYLLAHDGKARTDMVHVVWIGGNNYLAVSDDGEETVRKVNQAWVRSMERLVEKGASYILVMNIPNLGKTPAAHEMGLETLWTHAINRHNETLKASFDMLQSKYPKVQWLYFDAAYYIDEMLSHPAFYGFSNVTDSCYDALLDKPTLRGVLRMTKKIPAILPDAATCNGFLFFDQVHSTVRSHEVLALKVYQLLKVAGIHFGAE